MPRGRSRGAALQEGCAHGGTAGAGGLAGWHQDLGLDPFTWDPTHEGEEGGFLLGKSWTGRTNANEKLELVTIHLSSVLNPVAAEDKYQLREGFR